jgi:hypothetical protein
MFSAIWFFIGVLSFGGDWSFRWPRLASNGLGGNLQPIAVHFDPAVRVEVLAAHIAARRTTNLPRPGSIAVVSGVGYFFANAWIVLEHGATF